MQIKNNTMKHLLKTLCSLYIILFLFCSCRKEVKIREVVMNDSLFKTIVVDPREKKNYNQLAIISEIAVGVEYIPLQTADSILIGKVNKLIVRDGKYYIWDSLSETIFCFDGNGRYSHKIQKQGQGPGEYPRISNFIMDMESGNICIRSDVARAILTYTEKGDFLKKTSTPLFLRSFAVQKDYSYYYLGGKQNEDFFGKDYPNQYRYVVMKNGECINQQLDFTYDEKFSLIPLSDDNFTFYKDTILLFEDLKPEIYTIDSVGCLKPRYRIEFLTNTYTPSFNIDIDLDKMKTEKENGRLATLWNKFYENDNYIFFGYSWGGTIGSIYVNKNDNTIHNMGFFLKDDFNNNPLSITPDYVDEDYMYTIEEPSILLSAKSGASPYLKNILDKIEEFDNPVIAKIKLKK